MIQSRIRAKRPDTHEYDEWRDYDNEGNHFLFVRLKKVFSPRKVRWRIETTFFTGNCIVVSRESYGPAEKMTPRCALNVEPLK